MTNAIKPNKIIFYFCIPLKLWKKIQVTPSSHIKCLNDFLKPENNFVYVYEGNIIDPNKTFENIGMEEGKIIFCFDMKKDVIVDDDFYSIWKKNANDPNFVNRLKLASNTNINYHYNRINDIKTMKIEGSHKLYRKQMRQVYLNNQIDDIIQNNDKSDINFTSTAPCTEAMPILW